MTTDTDIRLRSQLDANQRAREQMCRAILALDPHYSDVRPRHPSGGPDGGRDIEATYDASLAAFGAVGFVNGANDSVEQKKQIRAKFRDDLASALAARPDLKVFAFLTNLHLAVSEQDAMKAESKKAGVLHCDVLDRERLRIELDTPGGFFVRFQYLDIPLSPAEQASFLSKYGDQVQDIVSTGFQRIEKTLNRLLFLAESNDVLSGIYVRFALKQGYDAAEIGHFRAFVYLALRAVTHDIFTIWFGSTDKSARFRDDADKLGDDYGKQAGIKFGIAGGQWEQHIRQPNQEIDGVDTTEDTDNNDKDDADLYIPVGWSDSRGQDPVPAILAHYNHDGGMIRFRPRLLLKDLDDASFMPVLNRGLAEKLHSIQVFANGYKIADFGPSDFSIDSSNWSSKAPGAFTVDELADPWVRIRPSSMSSSFHLRFSETTPRRLFDHKETPDSSLPEGHS